MSETLPTRTRTYANGVAFEDISAWLFYFQIVKCRRVRYPNERERYACPSVCAVLETVNPERAFALGQEDISRLYHLFFRPIPAEEKNTLNYMLEAVTQTDGWSDFSVGAWPEPDWASVSNFYRLEPTICQLKFEWRFYAEGDLEVYPWGPFIADFRSAVEETAKWSR